MSSDDPVAFAENLVNEFLESNAKILNLSGLKLTTLPKSLFSAEVCERIKQLDLSNNQLTSLPVEIGQLQNLETLEVSNNQLTSLPVEIVQLQNLKTLYVYNNQLTSLPVEIVQLQNLETLVVSNNQLTSLPVEIGQLKSLSRFDIDNNQLTSLPVEIGQLTSLSRFDIDNNQLTSLPVEIVQLQNLKTLYVYNNQLTSLPVEIVQLQNLETLVVSNNQLTSLPVEIGQLQNLKTLEVSNNQLTSLPVEIGQLQNLETLRVDENELTSLPIEIGQLKSLSRFDIDNNQLTSLPVEIGQLQNLKRLYVSNNQLTSLPVEIVQLQNLKTLEVQDNQLAGELATLQSKSASEIIAYLRELAKGETKRFEGKLFILGNGNEGKTCISRALRNQPFVKNHESTVGVDIEELVLDHPTQQGASLILNIWDFEGQEIAHQTHQLFLRSDCVYLVVFRCRERFEIDVARYWLDTIKSRAPSAKVAIVITECETTSPVVPEDVLEAEYRELLFEEKWLFHVGCSIDPTNKQSGIPELKNAITAQACALTHIGDGQIWPSSYEQIETHLDIIAENESSIERSRFDEVCKEQEISSQDFRSVESAFSSIGIITSFQGNPKLEDFIVLRPQWLTKAIREVMEDKDLVNDKGKIAHSSLKRIWDNKSEYAGFFNSFHACMKEFELCYDLEDGYSLVPLRFSYRAPAIPWSASTGRKVRRVMYKFNLNPPFGLISRLIVKLHELIVQNEEFPNGVYWHNGAFLSSGEEDEQFRSEALIEYRSQEKSIYVEVRAAFPQLLVERIHGFANSVFKDFPGLETYRYFGCVKTDEKDNELECPGFHSENRIWAEISEGNKKMVCEHDVPRTHKLDPSTLILGIGSFGEDFLSARIKQSVNTALGPIQSSLTSLLEWAENNSENIESILEKQDQLVPALKQEMELRFQEYLVQMDRLLDQRNENRHPRVFSFRQISKDWTNIQFRLVPFCECPGKLHPCKPIEFTKSKDWWAKNGWWFAKATKYLSVGLNLFFMGIPKYLSDNVWKEIKDDVNFMKALNKHLGTLASGEVKDSIDKLEKRREFENLDFRGDSVEGMTFTEFSIILHEIKPESENPNQWGELTRYRQRDSSYLWLCDEHKPS